MHGTYRGQLFDSISSAENEESFEWSSRLRLLFESSSKLFHEALSKWQVHYVNAKSTALGRRLLIGGSGVDAEVSNELGEGTMGESRSLGSESRSSLSKSHWRFYRIRFQPRLAEGPLIFKRF